MTVKSLFPTSLLQARLSEAELLLPELETACWMIEEGDTAGQQWCDTEGYPGYTSYASLNDLATRAPAFATLQTELDNHAAAFAKPLHWDMGTAHLVCDSLWINIQAEGGAHSGHIHPNSVLSGTIYIAVPEGAGAIQFEDPRLGFMMAAPKLVSDIPDTEKRFVSIAPQPGDILIWESWLRHQVLMNRSEDARISISFNYSIVD